MTTTRFVLRQPPSFRPPFRSPSFTFSLINRSVNRRNPSFAPSLIPGSPFSLYLPSSSSPPPRLRSCQYSFHRAYSSKSTHAGTEAIRFQVSQTNAKQNFNSWIYIHSQLFRRPTIVSVQSFYLPYWSFAADVTITYQASKGSTVPHVEKKYALNNPELQIYSGHQFPRSMVNVIKCNPLYAEAFEASMITSLEYEVEVEPFALYEATAWSLAKTAYTQHLREEYATNASSPYDTYGQKLPIKDIEFTNVVSRRILLPAHVITYQFLWENFRVFINGYNGEAFGIAQQYGSPLLWNILDVLSDAPKFVLKLLKVLGLGHASPAYVVSLGTWLAQMLRPLIKLFLFPPFLMGTFITFGTFFFRQAIRPIRAHRQSLAEFEELRATERKAQMNMDDNWSFRSTTTGGSSSSGSSNYSSGYQRSYSSSSSYQQQQQQSRQQQASYQQQQQTKTRTSTTGKKPPPVNENDYYAVLGCTKNADVSTISSCFRRQLLIYHPDHAEASGFDITAASERTRMIMNAYSVLRDPKKRKIYDATYKY